MSTEKGSISKIEIIPINLMNKLKTDRILWLDYLRVLACFLVIVVHVPEFSSGILEKSTTYFARIAVPLFFMISGYLTLPFDLDIKNLFKKRISRLIFPFLFWSFIYAILPYSYGELNLQSTLMLIYKIPLVLTAPHLWYMYAIIGMYLFAPLISPWLKIATKKQISFYLLLWAFTLFFPYLIKKYPEIEMNEWNSIYILNYFSGYLGYFILGFFIKKFPFDFSKLKYNLFFSSLLLLNFIIVILAYYFLNATIEVTKYLTINVALFAISVFMLVSQIHFKENNFSGLIVSLSINSFGIYLIHEFVLKYIVIKYFNLINYPLTIERLSISLITFLISFLIILFIKKIPISKFLIG